MATIESLVVKISAETSGLTKSIDKARTALTKIIPTGLIGNLFAPIGAAIKSFFKNLFGTIFDELAKIITKRAKEIGERIKGAVEPEIQALQRAIFETLGGPQFEGVLKQFEIDAVNILRNIIPQATEFVRSFDMTSVNQGLSTVLNTVKLLGEALELLIVPLRVVAAIGKFFATDIGRSIEFGRALGGGNKGAVETEDSALLEESQRQTEAIRGLGDKLGAGAIARFG